MKSFWRGPQLEKVVVGDYVTGTGTGKFRVEAQVPLAVALGGMRPD